jgi:hypothetical protein
MPSLDRRAFLRSSLAGAALSFTSAWRPDLLWGADPPPAGEGKTAEKSAAEKLGLDSLFLTWQQDPTTTMTIQWVGPAAAGDTSLRYVPRTGDAWRTATATVKPFPATDLSVHRCELTGLAPGAEYVFRIGANSRAYRFRTMPAKATDTIQFVSGGDCGTGTNAIGTNVLAAKQEPYFALLGGDLAYDNGRSPNTMLTFLRNYSRHMVDPRGRLIPMISCMGNHEVDGGYKKTREKAPQYLSLFDGLFRETTYGVLDIGDYLSLVLLDTGHIAPIGGEQTDWLESTLEERQERPHLIVANHVPAYPSYRSPEGEKGALGTGQANRLHWCPLFENFKVDAVLEHHDHTFKRSHPLIDGRIDKYGVPYLGDGSWGKLRAPKKPEQRPYLATVGKAYHMTVHRLEGPQRFHVALESSGRIADIYSTTGKRPSRRG